MTMNFIPELNDDYHFATHTHRDAYMWENDSIDVEIARRTGVFSYTEDGRKLAELQHALRIETSMFWEWLDDYELYT